MCIKKKLIFLTFLFLFFSSSMLYASRIVENDLNKDGKIDQRIFYDWNGALEKLENDSDKNGIIESYQYYSNNKITRFEKDSNEDGFVDTKIIFKNGKKTRLERASLDPNNIDQIILYDENEAPSLLKKKIYNKDFFDTFYYFKDGILTSSTHDTNADGKVNIWQEFKSSKLFKRKTDKDFDGLVDFITYFNEKTERIKKLEDIDNDSKMEVLYIYKDNKIKWQKKDLNKDGFYEIVMQFEDEKIIEKKQDTNNDNVFDILTKYKDSTVCYEERDTNFDGVMDKFLFFDEKGVLVKTEEDSRFKGEIDKIKLFSKSKLIQMDYDMDGDNFIETTFFYENGGKKVYLQTKDKNKDKKVDVRTFFKNDRKIKVEIDSNFNGKMDMWQLYNKNGEIMKMQKDEDSDGGIDLVVFYKNGKRDYLIKDLNKDNFFELTQYFNKKEFDVVVEIKDKNTNLVMYRDCYNKDVLEKKELDQNLDGKIDSIEFYKNGKIIKSIDDQDSDDVFELTWFYDDKQQASYSELDKDNNGKPEVIYFYDKQGKIVQVQEDTDKDGNIDLVEEYDEKERLSVKKQDFNNDGVFDLIEENQKGL